MIDQLIKSANLIQNVFLFELLFKRDSILLKDSEATHLNTNLTEESCTQIDESYSTTIAFRSVK